MVISIFLGKYICKSRFTIGINDTGGKFATGVNVTGGGFRYSAEETAHSEAFRGSRKSQF